MYMGLMMLGRKIHAAETLVPQLSACEVEMSIEKLKRHKTPGIDQIPAELIKGWHRTISSEPINLFYLE